MMEIHLFVQEGCRPCMYAETQLKKTKDWDKVVTITNSKEDGEWSEFAKSCEVVATPTLVVLEEGEVKAKMTGSQSMNRAYWSKLVQHHLNSKKR